VRHHLGADLTRHVHDLLHDQRSREPRDHRVLPLVQTVRLDRVGEVLGGEPIDRVHHADVGRAGEPSPLHDRREVLLLAHVHRDGNHLVAPLAEPPDRDRRVEPTAVREHCALHPSASMM
jgi:hypothetical protein